MWTVLNGTSSSINVTDIPGDAVQILPYQSALFDFRDIEQSRILAENIGNGSLAVTSFGTFAEGGPWLPITYPVHPLATETQDGHSQLLTVGVFSVGKVLLNVASVDAALSSSIEVGWEEFDGTDYYPAQTILATTTQPGLTPLDFNDYGIAGRFSWTIVGSVEFALLFQLRN